MKTLKLLLAGIVSAFLVTAGVAVAYDPGSFNYDAGGGGASLGDGVTSATGTILPAGQSIDNATRLVGDSQGVAAFGDLGGSSSPVATTADKQVGAATIFRGGLGTTGLQTLVHANCAVGDAYTITGKDAAGNAITGGLGGGIIDITAGGNWTLGANNTEDAANAAAAVNANVYAAGYIYAISSGAHFGVGAVGGKVTDLTIALKTEGGGGACGTVVNGADGQILLNVGAHHYNGATSRPMLGGSSDPLTGMSISGGGYIYFLTSGGASYVRLNSGSINATGISGIVADAGPMSAATDMLCGDDYLPTVSAAATDVAPVVTTFTAQEPFANVALADQTNKTGGNMAVIPPNGSRRLASAGADMCTGADPCAVADGTTITFPTYTDGVLTNCVISHAAATNAGARQFHCNGHTPAECGASIITAMSTVSPCTLITKTAATNGVLGFSRVAGSISYIGKIVVSTGAAEIVAENGTDGAINIPQTRVVTGADTACTTTCGANRGCLFGQNTAALTYAIVDCSNATADVCVCLGGA